MPLAPAVGVSVGVADPLGVGPAVEAEGRGAAELGEALPVGPVPVGVGAPEALDVASGADEVREGSGAAVRVLWCTATLS